MRVANAASLISALEALPGGAISAPEVPDLQPSFAGGRPKAGAKSFVIESWQVGFAGCAW